MHLRKRPVIRIHVLALVTLALSVFGGLPASALAADAQDPGVPPPRTGSHVHTHRRVCDVSPAGVAACHARIRTDQDALSARPASGKHPVRARPDVLGNNGAYDPSYLQAAYNTALAGSGAGQTVAIVDAYDDPNAESDLAHYRSYFGLPACTTANGCFRKVNQNGQSSPLPPPSGAWAQEISLDLDMVSAVCPACKIVLVEASSPTFNDLGTAVNTAVRLGATVVSNSYGGGEFGSETSIDTSYFNHPGVAITVSSGDSGYGVQYPAASRYVTAVGGTSLFQSANGGSRSATETVWSGAGSGCSAYEAKPTWQHDSGCGNRTVADVSAVADPSTGVWVYDSYAFLGQSGWLVFGGTSVAAPVVGAIYALAGGSNTGYPSSYPYGAASALNDITSGSNGSCGSYLCTGQTGYDGPSGLGTPNGGAAFGYHAVADYSLAIAPSSGSAAPGGSASYSVTLSSGNGYSSPVNLTVSGLPAGATAGFSANPVTPTSSGATSTMTVNLSSSVAAGSYTLNVTATGTDASSTVHSGSVSLTVAKPDFTIAASPSSASMTAGGSTGYTVDLSAVSGYSSAVALSVSGLPSGVSAAFNPASVTPSGSATLSLTSSSATPAGTYTLTVAGKGSDSGATTHSTTVSLSVTSGSTGTPDFGLTLNPTSVTVSRGSSVTDTITLTALNGYGASVSLSASGLPNRTTATFSPNPVTPSPSGASSTLTIQTDRRTFPGTFSVRITARGSDGVTHTATLRLRVQ